MKHILLSVFFMILFCCSSYLELHRFQPDLLIFQPTKEKAYSRLYYSDSVVFEIHHDKIILYDKVTKFYREFITNGYVKSGKGHVIYATPQGIIDVYFGVSIDDIQRVEINYGGKVLVLTKEQLI